MEPFIESGMTFGPYPEGHCFRIEKSATYRSIGQGVKIAEFLLLRSRRDRPPIVLIVEAKQSSPRPETQPSFQEFVAEIRDKLGNTLALGMASMLGRHPMAKGELPHPFQVLDLGTVGFRLVLIINGHREDWLPPLQDALRITLCSTVQTWALGANAVVVINHEMARNAGLVAKEGWDALIFGSISHELFVEGKAVFSE